MLIASIEAGFSLLQLESGLDQVQGVHDAHFHAAFTKLQPLTFFRIYILTCRSSSRQLHGGMLGQRTRALLSSRTNNRPNQLL